MTPTLTLAAHQADPGQPIGSPSDAERGALPVGMCGSAAPRFDDAATHAAPLNTPLDNLLRRSMHTRKVKLRRLDLPGQALRPVRVQRPA